WRRHRQRPAARRVSRRVAACDPVLPADVRAPGPRPPRRSRLSGRLEQRVDPIGQDALGRTPLRTGRGGVARAAGSGRPPGPALAGMPPAARGPTEPTAALPGRTRRGRRGGRARAGQALESAGDREPNYFFRAFRTAFLYSTRCRLIDWIASVCLQLRPGPY